MNSFWRVCVYFALSLFMRNRICNIAVYLLLSCMLFEHAVPFFMIQTQIIELCQSKGENDSKDAKVSIDDNLVFNDGAHLLDILSVEYLSPTGSLIADSEEIPDSAHRPIFSPPPDEV